MGVEMIDNIHPGSHNLDHNAVVVGRLKKKITKLTKQRDFYHSRLKHYEEVLLMQPYLDTRYKKYIEMKEEQLYMKDLENRCREQSQLIQVLSKSQVIDADA